MKTVDNSQLEKIYRARFNDKDQAQREQMWQIICQDWMQRYIPQNATVLDLAAGRCEFINHIKAGRKIAVDLNEDVRNYANKDVEIVIAYSHNMQGVADNSVDVVFVSNFFEHLPDKAAFMDTLKDIRRVLKVGGKLLIMQPNIRFLHGAYWDFIDHYLPLTDRSVEEALMLTNMDVIENLPRFLPYTTRSKMPRHPLLIRLYLRMPIVFPIFGRQAWVVAVKPE